MRWGLLLALVAAVGCGDEIEPAPTGEVSFLYQLFDGGGVDIDSCTFSAGTLATVRLLLGDDLNNNGVLDDAEIVTQGESACNQSAELGSFGPVLVEAGDYSIFAVELVGDDGALIRWFAPVNNAPFLTRNSFGRTVTVTGDDGAVILFDDLGSVNFELQITF
jgi:hypothetical protein